MKMYFAGCTGEEHAEQILVNYRVNRLFSFFYCCEQRKVEDCLKMWVRSGIIGDCDYRGKVSKEVTGKRG